ncbi:hypothetical protein [Sphingomonas sp. R1]|uniref:hypothetical protein n=1 Tax=Sphingomonas sp. R1 TaxID=399176 RepID=UPI0022253367|nr:hypothetical protein [Sphingomonas sp. R1]UYY77523.1 hypothetical protein OIM94_00475 [Sphingomonas sp. R1]
MDSPSESYFSVATRHEAAAVAHVTNRGFPPCRIEREESGVSILVFPPLPEVEMAGLAQALPVHLSTKIGIVGGPPLR